ncbi:Mediator of RNA polymerase II transcription subunit 7 [Nakaseomyces bracarensis]|uniref:Mediator of RNA polymerase II transcription subunit 7 n=1 Tax=Nakaseomyces bracarensis TaxID=273131 RepID=A0ABR4NT53_9SACH
MSRAQSVDPNSNDVSSLYPPPPPYIKFFTKENVERVEEYRKRKTERQEQEQVGDGTHEVNELDFLIPPRMPESGNYRAFGSVWEVKDHLPDLETMGITQLYKKSEDTEQVTNYQYKIQELRKLSYSLLLNFVELVGVLSINPELYEQKVENIRTILVNIHHLLNEYRPHQSRESLIMLLEEQLEYKKKEVAHIDQVCEQVKLKLQEVQNLLREQEN